MQKHANNALTVTDRWKHGRLTRCT